MINNELATTWYNMHYDHDGLGTTLASAYRAMLRIAIRHDYDRTWDTSKQRAAMNSASRCVEILKCRICEFEKIMKCWSAMK